MVAMDGADWLILATIVVLIVFLSLSPMLWAWMRSKGSKKSRPVAEELIVAE